LPDQKGIPRTFIPPLIPDFDSIPPILSGLSDQEMVDARIQRLEKMIGEVLNYVKEQQQTLNFSTDLITQRINEFDVTAGTRDTKTVTTTSHTAADDGVILVDDDTAAATVTVTLPAADVSDGLIYHIKKLGTTANVIVDGSGSETIDDGTTATLTAQYESIMIVSDGTAWHII